MSSFGGNRKNFQTVFFYGNNFHLVNIFIEVFSLFFIINLIITKTEKRKTVVLKLLSWQIIAFLISQKINVRRSIS